MVVYHAWIFLPAENNTAYFQTEYLTLQTQRLMFYLDACSTFFLACITAVGFVPDRSIMGSIETRNLKEGKGLTTGWIIACE